MKRLLALTSCLVLGSLFAYSQSVPFPTGYRDYNAVSPWGYNQVGTTWDTSPYLPFIYQDMWFRLMPPPGVTYNKTTNTWSFPPNVKYPVILFFQGAGEIGTDNNNQLKWGGQIHRDAVLSGAWPGFLLYPQNVAADKAKILLEKLYTMLPMDYNRLNVHGLSNGGAWTWDFFVKNPTMVAGVFPMSASWEASKDTKLLFNPIRQAQGSLDVNPAPSWTQTIVDWYNSHGGNLEYFLLQGVGHGTWNFMYSRPDFFPWFLARKKNEIGVLFKKNLICPGDPISVTMGFTPGFTAYEWRKDGVLIAGATSNQLVATSFGSYTGRLLTRGVWTEWSDPVAVGQKPPTNTPAIQISGLKSKVLPAPDGSTSTSLTLPDGYETYTWRNAQNAIVGTTQIFTGATVGNYTAVVKEINGCSSIPSPVFTVIDANGPSKPEAINGLMGFATSQTALSLNWTDNPTPQFNETGFEIYRSTSATGPFTLIAINAADVDGYNDSNLLPNTTYYYLVRPVNQTSAGPVSAVLPVVTQVDAVAPTSPQGLQVVGTSTSSVSLSWLASTDDVGIYRYDIYKNGQKALAVTGTSATVYNLIENQVYNFTVRARDFTGNLSPESNQVTQAAVSAGLNYKYYEGSWTSLPNFNTLTPIKLGNTPNIDITVRNRDTNFALYWEGIINITVAGNYTFETSSADGSKVYFGTYNEANLLVNNDGSHSAQFRSGTKNFSAPGNYPIVITYFQNTGSFSMNLYWSNTPTGIGSRQLIPNSAFKAGYQYATPPAAPTQLTATAASYDRINLTWVDNSTNETGFQLHRATSNGGPYSVVATIPANTTSYSDVNLLPFTQYFYRIQAVGTNGQSGFSTELLHGLTYQYYEQTVTSIAQLDNFAPKKVGTSAYFDLSARDRNTNFGFKWQGTIRIPTAGSYTFYTASSDGSNLYIDGTLVVNNDFTQSNITERNGTRTLTAGLHAIAVNYRKGTTANIALTTSYQGPGIVKQPVPATSIGDTEVNAKTFALPATPASPSNLVATAASPNSIQLTWSDNSIDETSFQVLRATTPANLVFYKTLPANTSNFTDNGLLANLTYYYQVRAVNAGGNSSSNQASAKTLNSKPVITKLNSQIIKTGVQTQLSVLSTDADQEPLHLAGLNLPPTFATFTDQSDGSGTLTLTPSVSNIGVYPNVTIVVTDQHGGSDSTKFTLTVTDKNPPTILPIGNLTVAEGSSGTAIISATSDFGAANLVWTVTGLPSFAQFSVSNGIGSVVASPGYTNSGTYPVVVKAKDQLGVEATQNFSIIVTDKDPNVKISLNAVYGNSAGAPWNNLTGATTNALKDNAGNTTKVGVTFPTWSTWTDGAITGNNSGVFPDNVIHDYYYFGIFGLPNTVDVRVRGLDPTRNYNFSFLGSSIWTGAGDNGSTIYTIGANSVTLNVQGNSQNLAVINNVTPASDSSVTFTMSKFGTSPAGFLNAFVIESLYQNGTGPAAPRNLDASLNTDNTVKLTWIDAPFNEKGYDVYRSESKNGPFVKINGSALPVNSTQYSDAAISEGKKYFYKTTAFNDNGQADSNLDSLLLPNLAPRITISGSLNWTTNNTTTTTITAVDPPKNKFTLAVAGLPGFATYSPTGQTSGNVVANPLLKDLGNYSFTVTATDTLGAISTQQVNVTVSENTLYRILVNFSQNSNAPSPWNNTAKVPAANDVFANLRDETNVNRAVTLTLQTAFGGVYDQGAQTGNNSGVAPDAVLKEYYWFGAYNTAATVRMRVSGLSINNKYNFKFIASSSYTALGNNGSTIFTIGAKSSSVAVQNNISNLAVINNVVTNGAGEVTIDVTKSGDAAAGYVNGLIIEAVQIDPSILIPSNLIASGYSKTQILLTWSDNSSTETGFEIFRSDTQNGTYASIGTTATDINSFFDSSPVAGKVYYYKVRAILPGGPTAFTNVASSGTLAFSVYINVNGVSTYDAPIPWNNLTRISSDGDIFFGFKDDRALGTGMILRVDRAMEGANDWGMNTGNNSGIYPDVVLRSFYWTNAYEPAAIMTMGGLDQTFNYNFTFFGSINANFNVSTSWTIGNTSVSLREDMNISQTVSLNGAVPDQNSEIPIAIKEVPGSPWAIFNAMIINGYPTDRKVPAGGRVTPNEGSGNRREVRYGLANPVVTLYPNPATETSGLHIKSEDSSIGEVQSTVVNMLGVEVHHGSYNIDDINADFRLDVDNSTVPNGVYLLKLRYSDGHVVLSKFIKN